MADVSTSVRVERTPDDAWKVVREVGALDSWMPMVERCELDGERRTLTLGGGLGEIVEQILGVDDETRTLTYTIMSGPLAFDHYLATWTVVADGEGAEVTWHVAFEPPGLADLMKGTQEAALAGLKEHLEG